MKQPLKILFMGTGEIALPCFSALIESEHQLIGLITQPDKPVGRKQILTPPEIKTLALQHDVPVWQPVKARRKGFIDEVEALAPDLIVVMAYGQILPTRLIQSSRLGTINVHASLLPLYRGASCIQGPIADGLEKTGVTIMHVVKELDAGDVILQAETLITPEDTGGILHDRLAEISPPALLKAISLLSTGTAPRLPQDDSLSNYAPKLLRKDGLLDFSKPAASLERLIRAYHPWPGTYFIYQDKKGAEKRLKVFPPAQVMTTSDHTLQKECGDGLFLSITEVQPEGSKRMSASDFLKGDPFFKEG